MPTVKNVGEPCAREPHARFEVAAGGNQASRASMCRAAGRLSPTLPQTKPTIGSRRWDRTPTSQEVPGGLGVSPAWQQARGQPAARTTNGSLFIVADSIAPLHESNAPSGPASVCSARRTRDAANRHSGQAAGDGEYADENEGRCPPDL
jgi:hypothetical protein